MADSRLPPGHHTITPGMVVPGVPRLVEFLEQAFGGVGGPRYQGPDGHVIHTEVTIGDSVVMMGEPMEGFPPMPCMLAVYVDDVDGTYRKAVAAGGKSLEEPVDQFYGHRTARIQDPAGNHWSIHKVVEEVSEEEMKRRMQAMATA